MEISLGTNSFDTSLLRNKRALIAGVLAVFPVLFIISAGSLFRSAFLMLIIPFSVFIVMNFRLAAVFFVASLFMTIYYQHESVSELAGILLIISYFVTFKNNGKFTPIIFLPSLLVFFISLIPSYIYTESFIARILSLRLLVFTGVIFVITQYVTDYDKMKWLFRLFCFWVVINGIHVVFRGFAYGGRTFGFAGIMYVDYVGLGLAFVILNLFYQERNKFFYFSLTMLLLLALFFTQTRNAWISSFCLIFFLIVQFAIKSPEYGYRRKKVIASITLFILLIVLLLVFLNTVAPGVFARIEKSDVKSNVELANDLSGISSIATRFFIWHTSWNAFAAHPFTGIGFYSFPFISEKYSTIDPKLYKLFVKGVSPHLSFIAVAAEAGIIGLIGFLIFLFGSFKTGLQGLRISKSREEKFFSNIIFSFILYSLISMTMTDAWLFGHGLMLWAFLLGLANANLVIIRSKSVPQNLSTLSGND